MPGQCPKCKKAVYFAEEKIVLGKAYHKMCTKCAKCNKLLDSSTFTEHEEEMYCKSCYGRLFGPKGYGYGIGAGVLSMDDGTNGKAKIDNIALSFNDRTNFSLDARKFREAYCPEVQTFKTTIVPITKSYYIKPFYIKPYSRTVPTNGPVTSNIPATVQAYIAPLKEVAPAVKPVKPKWGGADYCLRCSKQVFMAERLMAAGGAWHKACFACRECHKRLDSHSIREREQDIYCNPCYGKNFGPKGYWGWSSAKVS